jgi:Txe/YoeB family toxin of Txe-Axe toxin-antitoxin module
VRLVFEDQGWEDYTSWLTTDRKMLARINKLIEDVRRDPFTWHRQALGAPAELGRDLRRGDRRIGGTGEARSKSARTAPQARHPPRRGTVSRTA